MSAYKSFHKINNFNSTVYSVVKLKIMYLCSINYTAVILHSVFFLFHSLHGFQVICADALVIDPFWRALKPSQRCVCCTYLSENGFFLFLVLQLILLLPPLLPVEQCFYIHEPVNNSCYIFHIFKN